MEILSSVWNLMDSLDKSTTLVCLLCVFVQLRLVNIQDRVFHSNFKDLEFSHKLFAKLNSKFQVDFINLTNLNNGTI